MPTIVIFDKQTGNRHEMEVKGTHTIDSVKAVLARELGYSQGEINLYLDKAPLSDGRQTFRALGLKDGTHLELITGDIGA